MTFHVERIDHVVLRVRDPPAMVRFYEQALGFKVERRLDRISLVQMRAGASLLDLVAAERADRMRPTWIISAFAWSRSTVTPSSRGWRRSAYRSAKPSSVTVRKATVRRSISTIRKETRSS